MSKKYRCCSYCDNTDHRDRGGYQIGDDDPTPHKKRGKGKSNKRYKGCPERNHGAHIYVWVEYRGKRYRWYEGENRYVDSIWWEKVCVGCGHRNTTRYPWYTWNSENEPYEIYEVRKVDHDWI